MKVGARFFKEGEQWWWQGMTKGSPAYRIKATVVVCPQCGDDFVTKLRSDGSTYTKVCSYSCSQAAQQVANPKRYSGERCARWKGGIMENFRGYRLIWMPDHPSLRNSKRKYVAEHRLVMEEHLGRYLESYEQVHHKNGIRNDNDIENLELWDTQKRGGQPPGQRVSEKKHCKTCVCFHQDFPIADSAFPATLGAFM